MIFDENTPKSSQFQKPVFGGKNWLRKSDGSRTGLSYAISGTLGLASGLSPLGARFGQQLDNLVQGGGRPGYLMDQDWYANNVRQSEGKANSISTITGGVGESIRSIAESVAGAMTGVGSSMPKADFIPQKPSEDPNISFRDMLSRRNIQAMTPEQRRRNEVQSQRQMSALPIQDENYWGTENLSDSPFSTPNFLKIIR